MIKIFSLIFVMMFSSQNIFAEVFKSDLNSEKINSFLKQMEAQLPDSIKSDLLKVSKNKVIEVRFENLGKLHLPSCNITVDSFTKAEEIEAELARVKKENKSEDLRYNSGIYLKVDAKRSQITLNVEMIKLIEGSATTYNCEHGDTQRLAQGAFMNAVARLLDYPVKSSSKEQKSAYRLSDNVQYRYKAGWDRDGNTDKDKRQAFWPRAINPFEFAGSIHDHFALNLEFFLMDPEYACRKPLLQEYFVKLFKVDPFDGKRNCSVNTKLLIPYEAIETFDAVRESKRHVLAEYDLSPERVYNINFFLAGIGTGAGSFGHSMYRIVTCDPGEPVTAACQKRQGNLVINPRANPLEMRLDNMKGAFGGYPSMFLVTPTHQIIEEYSIGELRNSYDVGMTGYQTTDELGNSVNVMNPDDKRRFLYAVLDQYWNYYGNYKFLSNNCADEALRLYQMSSTNSDILSYDPGLAKPFKIASKLSGEGLADTSDLDKQEKDTSILKAAFQMITRSGNKMKWSDFEEKCDLYSEMEFQNKTTNKSWKCHFYYSLRQILILEGASTKSVDNTKDIDKNFKEWLKLAKPKTKVSKRKPSEYSSAEEIPDEKRREILMGTIQEIRNRWLRLYNKGQTVQEKIKFTQYFYTVIDHLYWQRAEEIGNDAVQIAYEVVYHPGKNAKDAPNLPRKFGVTDAQYNTIKSAIDSFAELERAMMPYRELSVTSGYGIPLQDEVTRDQRFIELMDKEEDALQNVVNSVSGILGAEHVMLGDMGILKEEIAQARYSLEQQLNK